MKTRHIFTSCLIVLPVSLSAQLSPEIRACNLQAREIALRISEEVSSTMTSWERSQIVAIAEEVCIGNRAMSSTTNFDQASTSADNMAATPGDDKDQVDEEGRELLGDLKIIDPEDRVKRPGLKRK
jgi:D-mannonate dehydratase